MLENGTPPGSVPLGDVGGDPAHRTRTTLRARGGELHGEVGVFPVLLTDDLLELMGLTSSYHLWVVRPECGRVLR